MFDLVCCGSGEGCPVGFLGRVSGRQGEREAESGEESRGKEMWLRGVPACCEDCSITGENDAGGEVCGVLSEARD